MRTRSETNTTRDDISNEGAKQLTDQMVKTQTDRHAPPYVCFIPSSRCGTPVRSHRPILTTKDPRRRGHAPERREAARRAAFSSMQHGQRTHRKLWSGRPAGGAQLGAIGSRAPTSDLPASITTGVDPRAGRDRLQDWIANGRRPVSPTGHHRLREPTRRPPLGRDSCPPSCRRPGALPAAPTPTRRCRRDRGSVRSGSRPA